MTETEWMTTDRCSMYSGLDFLQERGLASLRKLRLLACAYLRRQWDWLVDPRNRAAVEAAEAFADGRLSREEMKAAAARAEAAYQELDRLHEQREDRDSSALLNQAEMAEEAFHVASLALTEPDGGPAYEFESLAEAVADQAAMLADIVGTIARRAGADTAQENAVLAAEKHAHAELVREIFGNPFRPVSFDPSWRTPGVLAIAQRIYEQRDFAALPILADALEEAGCTSEEVLVHLCSPDPHVRGCWALDLVMGKS
ncbi:MAG TPA: hypothetical protein VFA26_02535 [Gemmataceae bacterium]|nr:hypothetical protein [Gemmataceae bacterium]